MHMHTKTMNRALLMTALAAAVAPSYGPSQVANADDDYLGDDDYGYPESGYDDELGAPRRRVVRRAAPARGNKRAALARAFASRMASGGNPLRDFLMPFPVGTFTATSGPLTLPAQPQKRFIGERLVIAFGRNGTSATGLVTMTGLAVGVDPQFVVQGSVPADAFSPLAVGTRLKLDASVPGVLITLQLAVAPAPTMTDTIVVASTLIGPALS
jgi:hypothetical protein